MKNKIFLLCIICFFTACSKNQKLTAKENTIVTKNEIISNEDFGELEKLKPLLEIKIGTERNQVKEILNGYRFRKGDYAINAIKGSDGSWNIDVLKGDAPVTDTHSIQLDNKEELLDLAEEIFDNLEVAKSQSYSK